MLRRIKRSDAYRSHTFEQPFELTVDDQDKLDSMNILDGDGNVCRVLLRNKVVIHLMKETGLRLCTVHCLDEKHCWTFDVNKGNSRKPLAQWAVQVFLYICLHLHICIHLHICLFWYRFPALAQPKKSIKSEPQIILFCAPMARADMYWAI